MSSRKQLCTRKHLFVSVLSTVLYTGLFVAPQVYAESVAVIDSGIK